MLAAETELAKARAAPSPSAGSVAQAMSLRERLRKLQAAEAAGRVRPRTQLPSATAEVRQHSWCRCHVGPFWKGRQSLDGESSGGGPRMPLPTLSRPRRVCDAGKFAELIIS